MYRTICSRHTRREEKRIVNEKEIMKQMKEYQEQTRDNFSDVNDDIDDIRGHLVNLENITNQILTIVNQRKGE